ncbi:hypothetical protein WR25_16041 [Diploscapter pachys]|uniref:Uncharacterized protein n=1 Tax=Diploscapter pachys TaxID=2018661 RepID=A0A2A2M273_9BILA|nr:hypothetical protein WR25_16041 [Diploscapter pachys]
MRDIGALDGEGIGDPIEPVAGIGLRALAACGGGEAGVDAMDRTECMHRVGHVARRGAWRDQAGEMRMRRAAVDGPQSGNHVPCAWRPGRLYGVQHITPGHLLMPTADPVRHATLVAPYLYRTT